MPTVRSLPGGAGVVRRDDGEIVITQDVSDDRCRPLRGRVDHRPAQTWLDNVRSIVAGLLPPRAVSAEVIDEHGTRVTAMVGGVGAAILEQPITATRPSFGYRDEPGNARSASTSCRLDPPRGPRRTGALPRLRRRRVRRGPAHRRFAR
jgi:hypothetical protein